MCIRDSDYIGFVQTSQADARFAILGFEHFPAVLFEQCGDHRAQRLVIFNQQNGLHSVRWLAPLAADSGADCSDYLPNENRKGGERLSESRPCLLRLLPETFPDEDGVA